MANDSLLQRFGPGLPQRVQAAAASEAMPLDQRILADPEEVASHSLRRRRHFNVVMIPTVRIVGFHLLIVVLLLLSMGEPTGASWRPLWVYIAVVEVYCALSWLVLWQWYERVRRFDLGLVFLTMDLLLFTGAVYVAGGHTSWLFFVLALRVADQSFVSFRRAAAFAHMAPLCYFGMLVYEQVVDQVQFNWQTALAQVMLLYLSSLYILISSRSAEKLRTRMTGAVRLARDSIYQLQERSAQLAKAKEEAEAASVAKSQFLANMSHELKTPLNAIIGYSEMLLEDPDTDAQTRAADLAKIRMSAQHLLNLINEVLEIARLESGKTDIQNSEVDLCTLVQEAAFGLQTLALKGRNTLDVHCAPGLPRLMTDPAKLRQILLNLMGNALKFTEAGHVNVRARRADEGNALQLEVEDSGIGMSESQIARLFQPFTQADGSSTRKHGGVALGLTLTKRYCDMLGCELAVRSEPAVGTVFTVTLPLTVAQATEPAT